MPWARSVRLVLVDAEDVAGRVAERARVHVVIDRSRAVQQRAAELRRSSKHGRHVGDARVDGNPRSLPAGADPALDAATHAGVDHRVAIIKANFPSRMSFRVATRVDSRTVLDVMGAEHLLGKGDMLFLPPGSSRLIRVHGAFVTEAETNRVVEFWKAQARPDYDQTFLLAPPPDEGEDAEAAEFEGGDDPAYTDAVRVVLEMGKASTSTLQRRLRLGYGRAARILDMMQREGIIGPPDGSKPREVLKRPDWLEEVENQLR